MYASMGKRSLRTASLSLAALLALSLLVACYLYFKDYKNYFAERHGALVGATVRPSGGDSLFAKSWLTLKNNCGFEVECGLLTPKDNRKRYPAIVLLGGKATGKYAIDYAVDVKDAIIVAPDYPYEPRESYTLPEFLADVPAIRGVLLDMVPSVMLLTDYLWQRSDVDTTKLIILGYSFGAPFVPCIIAHDRRAGAAALVYGGGALTSLITHNVHRYEGAAMSGFVGLLGGLLLRPIEPMRYIENVGPTPLIMINGTEDEQMPRENVEPLFAKAKEPKRIIWIDSKHVNPRDVELRKRIVRTLREEFVSIGILDSTTLYR
jgi:hypothetical protein